MAASAVRARCDVRGETIARDRATGITSLTVATTWSPDKKPRSVVQVHVESPF
jgi:hypothetical protein